ARRPHAFRGRRSRHRRRRQQRSGRRRGDRAARRGRYPRRLLPDPRVSVRRGGRALSRDARTGARHRAEPRRAAQIAAHARDALPEGAPRAGAFLGRASGRLQRHRRRGEACETRGGGGMTSIAKPKILHRGLRRNGLGLTIRDYEGGMSTLCAGCGHDSITAAIVQAFFELDIPPHRVAKMSGIGCSSKTPAYFLGASHGFNSVHGRMPSIATGAGAANREIYLLGVSGDGDSLSIGLGQFVHAVRRNLDMVYIVENNGVYGLTKGQFSASADIGSKAKRGDVNRQPPIDPVQLAMALGGTFVARSFSGDKEQLVPLIKAAVRHEGFALIDVISPCVTFNDHEDSTKSYSYTRRFR